MEGADSIAAAVICRPNCSSIAIDNYKADRDDNPIAIKSVSTFGIGAEITRCAISLIRLRSDGMSTQQECHCGMCKFW